MLVLSHTLLVTTVSAGVSVNVAGEVGGVAAPSIFPANFQSSGLCFREVLCCLLMNTNITPPLSFAQASVFVNPTCRIVPELVTPYVGVVYVGSPFVLGPADTRAIPACNLGLIQR